MSTLREMAEELSARLKEMGEVDYFLVLQSRVQDPRTGQKPGMAISNLPTTQVMDAASRGTAGILLQNIRKNLGRGKRA